MPTTPGNQPDAQGQYQYMWVNGQWFRHVGGGSYQPSPTPPPAGSTVNPIYPTGQAPPPTGWWDTIMNPPGASNPPAGGTPPAGTPPAGTPPPAGGSPYGDNEEENLGFPQAAYMRGLTARGVRGSGGGIGEQYQRGGYSEARPVYSIGQFLDRGGQGGYSTTPEQGGLERFATQYDRGGTRRQAESILKRMFSQPGSTGVDTDPISEFDRGDFTTLRSRAGDLGSLIETALTRRLSPLARRYQSTPDAEEFANEYLAQAPQGGGGLMDYARRRYNLGSYGY